MRPEKKYLVDEVNRHLDKSSYVYLTNYERIKVDEIAELRESLSKHNAEFHVIKNNISHYNVASKIIELYEAIVFIQKVLELDSLNS